ncbi:TonB-dependent receptor plug domain-containing protein [Solimonas soli]|uniref:TonB-dependent receptor plug domain-containing protein n=1 Tax=Solimonas soli TaxID=413479 RepID=UPI00146FB40A|nr:TonB-dependent receptor [Solimonas soli]
MTEAKIWRAAMAPLALAAASFAHAQEPEAATVVASAPESVAEVLVTGDLKFRNRTEDANPVLSYDLEYFQRFEPVSVGEMLKRVPGVTFTSDVLEFDGVSMRGLPPGYTQILINGRRAPGGESDRSFFVDRIPAELVERIEIVRSPGADQPGDGIGGTLNIVLKEGADLEGGFIKGGALLNEDGKLRPAAALAYAGSSESTSYWAGLNDQGRRNPKQKSSWRYDGDGVLDNIEKQDDTRDGVDVSANGELTHRFGGGSFTLSGLVVDTDRDEDETSKTYVDSGSGAFDALKEIEVQRERISQQTYDVDLSGDFEAGAGKLSANVGWTGFREDSTAETDKGATFDGLALDEHIKTRITDDEYSGGIAYSLPLDAWKLKGGLDLLSKKRDGAEVEYDIEDDGSVGDPDPAPGAIYTIKETRIDPYLRATYAPTSALTLDLGLRAETTKRDVDSDDGSVNHKDTDWNPSLHLTYAMSAVDQLRASLARTVRRPDYDLLAPFTAKEEPTDGDDLQGNPHLKNETAWGLDVGYERRLGRLGVFGVDAFYRRISDLIETVNTGTASESGEGKVYEPRNLDDEGNTWGVEVDFSAPLAVLQMPDTGLFFNYSWMNSSVRDPYTGQSRRFTNQPHGVYNIGFIQTVRAWDMSFGASYYDRDAGCESNFDETVKVAYEADLEAFIEKRFGKRVVVRIAAMNLLDAHKDELFHKYDGDSVQDVLDNRRDGVVDEIEHESEHSGPLYELTLRVAF